LGNSVLERHSYRHLMLFDEDYSDWQAAGYPIVRDDE
jgi:hypothetical protein